MSEDKEVKPVHNIFAVPAPPAFDFDRTSEWPFLDPTIRRLPLCLRLEMSEVKKRKSGLYSTQWAGKRERSFRPSHYLNNSRSSAPATLNNVGGSTTPTVVWGLPHMSLDHLRFPQTHHSRLMQAFEALFEFFGDAALIARL
ncbi:hypothetical protein MRX96_036319 [Rhipicephalus microplus]